MHMPTLRSHTFSTGKTPSPRLATVVGQTQKRALA